MTYSRSPSAMTKAARVALSQAAASLRVCATAASCSRPLSRTTFASVSNSAITSDSVRKYRCRALGLSVRRCARRNAAFRVRSTDGGGISAVFCVGNVSGIRPTPTAPRRQDFIERGNSHACKAKNARAGRVRSCTSPSQRVPTLPRAAGPAGVWPPVASRTTHQGDPR